MEDNSAIPEITPEELIAEISQSSQEIQNEVSEETA